MSCLGIWTWPGRLISLKNRIQDLSAAQLIFQSRCFWVHCHQTSHYRSFSGKDNFKDIKGRWIQTQGSSSWGCRANHKAITKAFSIFKCFLRKDQFMFVPGEENRKRKKRWIKKEDDCFPRMLRKGGAGLIAVGVAVEGTSWACRRCRWTRIESEIPHPRRRPKFIFDKFLFFSFD